jgi:hypothetical protein
VWTDITMPFEQTYVRFFSEVSEKHYDGEVHCHLPTNSTVSMFDLAATRFEHEMGLKVRDVSLTVCMPYGNDHSYLLDALTSISSQTVPPNELLLGVDNARCELRLPQNTPTRVFYHRGRKGPFAVMQSLLSEAKTELVLFHDSDDISHPDRIYHLLAAMREHDADAVGSAVAYFSGTNPNIEVFGVFPLLPHIPLQRRYCHTMLYPSLLIRRSVFFEIGGFDHFELFGMDTEFLIRLARSKKVVNIALPVYFKRRRPDSLIESPATGMKSMRRREVIRYTIEKHRNLFLDTGSPEQGDNGDQSG